MKKLTAVSESLAYLKNIISAIEKIIWCNETSRMRNLHLQIREKYGIENVRIFRQWEKLEYKMAAFQNHRIFTLRCLKEDLIPVSVKLRSNFKHLELRLLSRRRRELYLMKELKYKQYHHHGNMQKGYMYKYPF